MTKKTITLKDRYNKEIAPALLKELGLKNVNAVPKLTKVTVNTGLGSIYTSGTKAFTEFVNNIAAITGQKPVIKISNKSISNFKLREGMPNGVTVTLRGKKMYDFVDRLVTVVFPRTRDFRGISPKSFDGHGNYAVGIKEHIVFPELNPDGVVKIHGLQVCINTTAKDNDQGLALLKAFGFPFKKPIVIKEEEEKEKKPMPKAEAKPEPEATPEEEAAPEEEAKSVEEAAPPEEEKKEPVEEPKVEENTADEAAGKSEENTEEPTDKPNN